MGPDVLLGGLLPAVDCLLQRLHLVVDAGELDTKILAKLINAFAHDRFSLVGSHLFNQVERQITWPSGRTRIDPGQFVSVFAVLLLNCIIRRRRGGRAGVAALEQIVA
jgi:hypothetical protein